VHERNLTRTGIERALSGLRWRLVLSLLAFACGLAAFRMGVGASDRDGIPDLGWLGQCYYTAGLFVLGGMDLGVPTGGTPLARALLWMAYLGAPTITAEALIEGVLRAIRPRHWALRRIRHHVVIAGCGKLAMQYLARLRATHSRKPVVVVEKHADAPNLDEARDVYGAHIVAGDVDSDALLGVLRLDHADRAILLTGDDFVNLDAAAKILTLAPGLAGRIVVHVADLHFLRAVRGTRIAESCIVFNTHQIAAEKLVRHELVAHFDRTEPLDTVVLAGFGRFGQTVLAELQKLAAGRFHRVVLVDLDCRRRAELFAEEIGFAPGYAREQLDGDMRDPELWRGLAERFGFDRGEPAFVLGSGDDGVNLALAIRLKARYPNAFIVARSFRESAYARELAKDGGVSVFSVADLVAAAIPDDWLA
jgi:Trk K+ transport system NAD-binding subunit